ncbi:MAG: hypothetical protein MOIL_00542 [Candidatus Methanolliviera sp. GoM_oil]|nr:MAG: hypothetical protein MOIL_00542 [Candidatus Methanolliviera sp. GoM_oil]
MKDSRYRSVVKTLSYRLIAIAITTTVTYILTRNILLSASVGGLDSLLKILLYYIHERMWAGVKWGRIFDSIDLKQKP